MSDGRPNTDPPTEAHDSNQLGGEEPAFYAAAAALDNLDTDLSDHAGATGDVHGVPAGDSVAGQSDVDTVTSDLNDHAGSTSGVHGVGSSNVESVSGAQSKADSAESSAKSYTDDHANKSNPHGITTGKIGALDASDYNPEADTHNPPTSTQTERKQGNVTGAYFGNQEWETSPGNTTELTKSISGEFSDEVILIFDNGQRDQTINSFSVTASDGSTIVDETINENIAAYTEVTYSYLFEGAVPDSFTLSITNPSDNNITSQPSVRVKYVTPFLPEHNHQI